MSSVATGLATGQQATPEIAKLAVSRAMEKAGITSPTAVLLFLTSEFAKDPEPAIKAAAKAAACTQIIGCSAPGIFTEEDWVLDSPAAAAMVFSDTATLSTTAKKTNPVLTLAAPNAINRAWLDQSTLRFGGIAGDATGQGAFSVWQNGKGAQQGYCEVSIQQATSAILASHGLKIISKPKKVSRVEQLQLLSVDGIGALSSLHQAWQQQHQAQNLPLHQLVAIYANNQEVISNGEDYHVASIITTDENNGTITLSKVLEQNNWLSWGIRDTNSAQVDMVKTARKLRLTLMSEPSFAMLFSCLGRGPSFYNGSDQDLELVKTLFPALPIIGFYGNGEIAPILGRSELLQYATVLGLFSEKNND